jgi:tetratricopeptide (TPR) repeat protein
MSATVLGKIGNGTPEIGQKKIQELMAKEPSARFWGEIILLRLYLDQERMSEALDYSKTLEELDWETISGSKVATKRNSFFLANLWALEGEILLRQGKPVEACRVWEQIFQSGSLEAQFFNDLHKERGKVYYKMGNQLLAYEHWRDLVFEEVKWKRLSLEIVPDFADLLVRMNRKDRAIDLLQKAVALDTDNMDFRRRLSKLKDPSFVDDYLEEQRIDPQDKKEIIILGF